MELLILLIGLYIIGVPILAIVALVKASDAQRKCAEHEKRLHPQSQRMDQQGPQPFQPQSAPQPRPAPQSVKPATPVTTPRPPSETKAPPRPKPAPLSTPKPTRETKPKPKINIEEALGGKIAGFIGVMILVAGIAFLVGSPGITWPSPRVKILIGLAFGGVLLTAGHVANRMASGKFIQLARTMTGGGGGLFYFCIFAAYSLYHLSGPVITALGLTLSAALLLTLSLIYNSQVVATLGILGAFITPLLTGADVDQGIFPLAYIALINLPVMFLGIKKNWQILYNSAYGFTLFYFYYWIISFNPDGWLTPTLASMVYFLEFITLSLLIVKKAERKEPGRLNTIRVGASALFLLLNFYIIFNGTIRSSWLGGCFAFTTLLLSACTMLCHKWEKDLKGETLQLLLWTIASGFLFILEAFTGSLQGLLWTAQALGLFWFFRKLERRKLHLAPIIISLTGLVSLSWVVLNTHTPTTPWFNLETSMLTGGILLQSLACWILWHHKRITMARLLQLSCFAAFLPAALMDIFEFHSTNWLSWLVATVAFAGLATFAQKRHTAFKEETLHFTLTSIFCLVIFLHMALSGLWISAAWTLLGIGTALFSLRIHSKEIQNTAIIIGFSSLIHATVQPIHLGTDIILLNPHTLCGLFCALAIGFQAYLYGHLEQNEKLPHHARALWLVCIGAILIISARNLFTVLDPGSPWPWLLTSIILLFVGNMINWMLGTDDLLRATGRILVAAVPLKIILLDAPLPWLIQNTTPSLLSITVWIQLAMIIETLWFAHRISNKSKSLDVYYTLAPLISMITLISLAIGSANISWSWALVSLWWGVSGLTLTLFGFARKSKIHRHFALILFAATIAKVLLIDCSVFQAGARVMIFIGIGLVLLVLSFIYQKVSARVL